LDIDKIVINLSDSELNSATKSVLAKGLNFAVAPQRIPVEDIITGVETGIYKLSSDDAETVRQLTCDILRKAKPPISNISTDERTALKQLKLNKNLSILPADKGNVTVVMNTKDYKDKIRTLLDDTDTYKIHNRDPITYLEKTTRSKILASTIDQNRQKSLIPRAHSSQIPKLYGLPKIHKSNVPLRPIVSAVGSPTQALAKYLAWRLQPYVEQANSYVKNSEDFITKILNVDVERDDILVSFDVVSLFTNIPVQEAIDIINNKLDLPDDIIDLISHCLNNTFFQYEGQIYKQTKGTPMGSPLSPVVANIFMIELEERAILNAEFKPDMWLRYVDDTFIIWKHGHDRLKDFLTYLNTLHTSIKFTMEVEADGSLPFLDVKVHKRDNNKLGHTVYRKPTHTNRYLNAASHHHPAQIASVAHTLIERARRLADTEHRDQEVKEVSSILAANGFSRRIIKSAIHKRSKSPKEKETSKGRVFMPYVRGTTDKICRMLRRYGIDSVFDTDRKISNCLRGVKDIVPLESQGVYEIPCGSCDLTYVGRTNRKISTRRAEHQLDVKQRKTTSTLATHVMTEGHVIDFPNTRTLSRLNNESCRIYREAIEIEKRLTMNARDDALRLPNAWKPVLHSYNTNMCSRPAPAMNPSVARAETAVPPHVEVPRMMTRSQLRARNEERRQLDHSS
jgi:uncharacterized protein (UPF0335 family)